MIENGGMAHAVMQDAALLRLLYLYVWLISLEGAHAACSAGQDVVYCDS